jgi:hypothetical protein
MTNSHPINCETTAANDDAMPGGDALLALTRLLGRQAAREMVASDETPNPSHNGGGDEQSQARSSADTR